MEVSQLQFIDVVLFQFVDEVVDMPGAHVRFLSCWKLWRIRSSSSSTGECPVVGPWWCRARSDATPMVGETLLLVLFA